MIQFGRVAAATRLAMLPAGSIAGALYQKL